MAVVAITIRGLLYLAALIVFLLQIRADRHRYAEPLAWSLAMVHGLAYSVTYLIDYRDGVIDGLVYNDWARILWIHVMLVLLVIETLRLMRIRRGLNGCK